MSIISCDKSEDLIQDDISGTYKGTLTLDVANKSVGKDLQKNATESATATIRVNGDHIELECFNDNFYESVMLDIYKNNDSIMVCLTGNDFENMYGHSLNQDGARSMSGMNGMSGAMGNMMGDWMTHMNNNHQNGDEHFGGFNMQDGSFGYTFRTSEGDYHFQGDKE